MFLLLHIILALASLFISTIALFSPSSLKLNLTYLLTIGTLLAAGGLVVVDHASMSRTCMTAFVYLAIVSVNVFILKQKLSTAESSE
jgi:phosphate starvation-inducible membrane PsiE